MAAQEQVVYKNTQIGYVAGSAGLVGMLITYYGFMVEDGGLGILGSVLMGLFGAIAVLFSTLTTEVTGQAFRFYFGPGFWERSFSHEDIRSVKVVRTAAYSGWGIRYTVHGWLYNVSGLCAVEVDIQGEGRIRVGTNEPEQLKQALEEAAQPA